MKSFWYYQACVHETYYKGIVESNDEGFPVIAVEEILQTQFPNMHHVKLTLTQEISETTYSQIKEINAKQGSGDIIRLL
jgi:hypothetical protein